MRMVDERKVSRTGDNGTPSRELRSRSVEAQFEEASCRLKEGDGSFRV